MENTSTDKIISIHAAQKEYFRSGATLCPCFRKNMLKKLLEGSEEIFDSIRAGYVSYVINTRAILSGVHYDDGVLIRRCAIENGVTLFSNLDTVRIVLDVLEEITNKVSTIDAK